MSDSSVKHPFGGIFGTIGMIVGIGVGYDLTQDGVAAIVGGLLGAGVGIFVEHLVYRVLVIAVGVLFLMARSGLLQAMFS